MTREQFAEMIHWSWIISFFGIINIGAMIPQLWTILTTRKTEGLNLRMIGIILSIQIAFSLEGYFKRNDVLLFSNLFAAVFAMSTILATRWVRRHNQSRNESSSMC